MEGWSPTGFTIGLCLCISSESSTGLHLALALPEAQQEPAAARTGAFTSERHRTVKILSMLLLITTKMKCIQKTPFFHFVSISIRYIYIFFTVCAVIFVFNPHRANASIDEWNIHPHFTDYRWKILIRFRLPRPLPATDSHKTCPCYVHPQ